MFSNLNSPFESYARLRAWAQAPDRAKADKVFRVELGSIPAKARGDYIVNELAPLAVQILAQGGHADKAADLLTVLGTFQPTPRGAALGVSHARELAQLRQDLTTYTTS